MINLIFSRNIRHSQHKKSKLIFWLKIVVVIWLIYLISALTMLEFEYKQAEQLYQKILNSAGQKSSTEIKKQIVLIENLMQITKNTNKQNQWQSAALKLINDKLAQKNFIQSFDMGAVNLDEDNLEINVALVFGMAQNPSQIIEQLKKEPLLSEVSIQTSVSESLRKRINLKLLINKHAITKNESP